ncbi:UDP-3-O-(3-hydroxymyristoyl)glucosamine N-acyltransferase [Gramella sp. AN32]|uniref:UDP-3-O-(3-hydroxymyristoyl)glucosamine N-acyltransferase n=1 Tax=Christiangramia antarctica TaxID=2058158 RepID=A0ABW5X5V6_9FLAO|nr:UDP-3-O-(3-hydroxymyristoyl)glucosamine N-acyltransferase [Gramella sp. AN32]MCM4156087.1 UDP-3-O-(3-hydroxymyristoyl)glucosamine N-acyltransferase [Gramella sp. AN32]
MKFPRRYSLKEIAALIQCEYLGDDDFPVMGMNEIHVVTPGDIVFVDHPKYYDKALKSDASIVLINKEVECPVGKALLISEDPFTDFNKLTLHFQPFQRSEKLISDSAEVGAGTILQPNVFLGNEVKIGKNCLIHANVSIGDRCEIDDNVIIHSGTVLGGDAFYYKKRPEGFDKLRSGGRVVIKDDVEIGSNCTIDRGVTGDTIIGKGSKLDNLIQIGHDTVIGKNCLIASQTGIAGCVIVENNVTIWGQVGIRSDITITEGTVLMAQSGISKTTTPGMSYWGSPAMEAKAKLKELAFIKQIPKLIDQLNKKDNGFKK